MKRRRLVVATVLGLSGLAGLAFWLLTESDASNEAATAPRPSLAAAAPPAEAEPLAPPAELAPAAASELLAPGSAADAPSFGEELRVSFSGRVVDESGRGIGGARMELVPGPANENVSGMPLGDTPPALVRATSDTGGAFRLLLAEGDVSVSGRSVYLRAVATGFSPAARIVHPLRAGDTSLGSIVLASGGSVRGHLVDASGLEVAGASILLAPPAEKASSGLARVLSDIAPASTGPDGRFVLESVRAGAVQLLVKAPGRPVWRARTEAVLPAGGQIDLGTLTLPAGETLAGVLLDEVGPVAGGELRLRDRMGWNAATVTSDADGRFRLTGFAPGQLSLKASAAEHITFEQPVTLPASEPLEFHLARTHKLLVRARDADGRPVQRGHASLRRERAEVAGADFRDGVAEVPLLSDGLLLITAEGCAPRIVDGVAELKGEQALQLERESVIRGRAHLLEPQTPLAGLRVRTTSAPQALGKAGFQATAITDTDGCFELRGLAAGEWPISADRPGLRPGRFGDTLAAGETKELDLAFAAGGRLEGLVQNGRGEAVPGVEVRADPGKFRGLSGDDGRFTIEGLPPSDVLVSAGSSHDAVPAHIDDGQTTVVTLLVPAASVIAGRVHSGVRELPDARVLLSGPNGRAFQPAVGPHGDFRAEDLMPGSWTVEARLADGLRRASVPVELAEGAEQLVDLDVVGGRLRVVVRGAEDHVPLAGAIVRAESGPRNNTGELPTAADGSVVLADLPPGEVRLLVRAERHMEVERKLELKAGVPETIVEVELDGAARIEGLLRAADGGDLPVVVELQRADGSTQGPPHDPWSAFNSMQPVAAAGNRDTPVKDGRFSFDHVPPGSVVLVVRQQAFGPKHEAPDLETLPLELRAGDVARPEITVQPVRAK